MNYIKSLFLLILFFGVISCKTDTSKFNLTGFNQNVIDSLILFDDIDQITLDKDGAAINSASLTGDILNLNLSYSGGCEDHEFKLYIWTGLSKSNPPQAEIYLSHNANGDLCEAYLTENLVFDLLQLKKSVRQKFNNVDEIWLRIYPPASSDPFEPLVKYKF